MDDEYRVMLRGAFQFLEQQQKQLTQVMIVTYALHNALRETHPEVELAYAKHYEAQSVGPLKIGGDEARKALAQLILRLSD